MGGGEGGGVGWEGVCDEGSVAASVGSEGVGVSQEMGDDGGVPPHSRISLMNNQSTSWLGNWKLMISSVISVSDIATVVLDTELGKEQFCVVGLLTSCRPN